MSELRECPFCGATPVLTTQGNDYTKRRKAIIHCKGCNTTQAVGAIRNTLQWCEETIIKNWNTRFTK